MAIVNQKVIQYITDSIKQGYDEISIRASLKVNGYQETEINAAFDYLHKTNPQHLKIHMNKKLALFLAGGVIVIIIIGLILFALMGGEKQEQIKKLVDAADQIGGEKIGQDTSTKTKSDTAASEKDIIIDGEKITKDDNIIDVPGENIREQQEYVEELAKTNPKIASTKCNEFNSEYDVNNCYTNLAIKLDNPKLCLEIAKLSVKDSCLINFARQGDNVCGDISDEFLKTNCQDTQEQLNALNSIPAINPNIENCDDIIDTKTKELCDTLSANANQ